MCIRDREEIGTYEVKVKAKDTNGQESDFSDPSTINISLPFEVGVTGLYGGFGGITVDITNMRNESVPALIADITIDLAGGTIPGFHINKHYTDMVVIESGTTETVTIPCFALGRFEITVTVECAGKPVHTTSAMGYILFFYVILT